MFVVEIDEIKGNESNRREYSHVQRKIAMRQFESYKKWPEVVALSVIHRTRRLDTVVATWERP